MGIEALSLYAFSTENWKRPKPEVDTLFSIFMEYFIKEVDALHKNNVAIRAMGDIEALPEKVCRECLAAMEKTGSNTGLKLNIGLNYGGRAETLHAVKSIAGDIISGKLNIEDIDEGSMMQRLYTSGLPDVDLVIRTGGEKRLSNFMLLQSAYAELIFTDTLCKLEHKVKGYGVLFVDENVRLIYYNDDLPVRLMHNIVIAVFDDLVVQIFQD